MTEWLGLLVQPAVILGGGALFLNQLNKRIDSLRSDMKDGMAKLNDRQREDNKALNEKLDRLLESRLPAPR
ncbi:hypothetical protein [Candidatus Synechococcus spongiarum]|uniref:hypothetical protein n=1 Tax=Candidatus Synechococcus spongiarum TaxID=431041 RepID=UPI0009421AD1|nr:hypothetical protein [Candidatus Synechococcus spongiarum]